MGQDPHLQPQLDFPFFLSLTRVTIIAATMIARTAHMIIVTIFSAIHANIPNDSFHFLFKGGSVDFDLRGQLGRFLVRTHEHPDHSGKHRNGKDKTDNVDISGEETAELVDHKSDAVCKAALITDSEPCPLCVVHLTLDSADSREAGCAEEVEYEEGITRDAVEGRRDILVNGPVAASVEDAERTDNVFLCDKSRDGCHGSLPVAPAERLEDPGDHRR